MAPGSRLQELTAKYMQNPRRFFVPLANEYRKSNELDRAIALCREHLPAQPGHMSGHIVLGTAYFEKGDLEAAREVFLTSVELDDENLIALRHLGDIARSRSELKEARQWYARVLDADPRNEEIERLLRSLGTVTGDAPEAAESAVTSVINESVGDVLINEPELASALADPTPPGLRAIFTSGRSDAITSPDVRPSPDLMDLPPVPRAPYDRLDLSTLGAEPQAAESSQSLIKVDDGVGFVFDDLDELVDTADAGATGLSLPPVDEADFSAGISTPSAPRIVPDEPVADELLTRPEFGALASFASWRTAQARDTPTSQPVVPAPAVPQASVEVPPEPDTRLFDESPGSGATATAPEFVTETMAALYAKQGFIQQALDIYRTLLARAPGDTQLMARVAEMEAALLPGVSENSLEADADKALQFDMIDAPASGDDLSQSFLETMYEISPPAVTDEREMGFGSAWEADDAAGDDWFADAPSAEPAGAGATPGDVFFGLSVEGFVKPGRPSLAGESLVPKIDLVAVSLASVFGTPATLAADDAASEMLLSLAAQMVGRLPKEAPTLPVPDVLELPAAIAGDEATGASPAPLLSFDRFFSGSGAPPRPRVDTPAATRSATPAPVLPAPASPPSLSPTFGGVPVIPASPSVTPATWAAFDQFLPPVATPPRATPAPAASRPTETPAPPAPTGESALPGSEPRPKALPTAPAPDAAAAERAPAEPPREVPSEFHRWLEGLT